MIRSIRGNIVVKPKRAHSQNNFFFGLTFEQDPRPRCSLIIGDGFTQSFLKSQDLLDKIPMSVNHHFPPPNNIMYIPVDDDTFTKSPIWDKKKWPNLYKHWEESKKSGYDFYQSLPTIDVNPDKKTGTLSYDTASLAFELRCYLWHLFRSHWFELERLATSDFKNWEWIKPLEFFLREFSLGIVSFNYDLLAEKTLSNTFGKMVIHHNSGNHRDFLRRPYDSVALYKMHGSISYYLDAMWKSSANPWLSQTLYEKNTIPNINLNINHEMNNFPELPDIVPPGHYGEDKLNPQSSVLSLGKSHIRASQLVVFCGLSAKDPDTDEVKELINEIRADALVLQVGLPGDDKNQLAQMLLNKGINCKFLVPEELTAIDKVIGDRMPLCRDWSTF